jgi:hypothetical protein
MAELDRENAIMESETERSERELESMRSRASINRSYDSPKKSSVVKDTITAAAIYHFLKKLF